MKILVRKTLIILSLLVSSQLLTGQQYILKQYSLDEGLLQASVLTIYQDYSGQVWFGTQGGVSRFDGTRFENWDTRHGLGDNHVTAIIQDSKNRYWFGHRYNGLSIMRHDSIFPVRATDARINVITEDRNGNIWLGTFGKGVLELPEGKEPVPVNFTEHEINKHLQSLYIADIKQTPDGLLMIATLEGLYIMQSGTGEELKFTVFNQQEGNLPFSAVLSIANEKDNYYWLLGYEGIAKISVESLSEIKVLGYYPFTETVNVGLIESIAVDTSGTVWCGHDNGVLRLIDGQYQYHFPAKGVNSDEFNCTFLDIEGNIWLGSMSQGVFKYSGDKFMVFDQEGGAPGNIVNAVIVDDRGYLWIATENGIGIWDGKQYEYFTEDNLLPSNKVDALFQDSKGYVWIGYYTDGPLLRYNPRTRRLDRFTTQNGLPFESVLAIEEDAKGDIWFGTLGLGLFTYHYNSDGNSGYFSKIDDNALPSLEIWDIHCDRKGNIWLATDDAGLVKYTGDAFISYKTEDGLNSLSIGSLCNDSKNVLWIGSIGGGVYRYDGQFFTNYNLNQGLSSASPFTIICDQNDRVIVGTNSGIDILDPISNKFRHFGKEDGFLGIENNQNAVFRDDEGIIWFGTMKGVIRFDPSKDILNQRPPITVLRSISVFYNPFDYREYSDRIDPLTGLPVGLRLPANMNHLTFEFAGISHISPERIRYRVKLQNFDTDWNPVTESNRVTYTNIPPGEYTFMVKSSNSDGIWNAEPLRFHFTILAPWWQTAWARILFIILFGGLGYLILWWRIHAIKEQKQNLQRIVNEKTRELRIKSEQRRKALLAAEEADNLKSAFLANMSHEIRTPVNSIIGFADLLKDGNLSAEEQKIYLDYIINGGNTLLKIINDIIDISKIEAGQLTVTKQPCSIDSLFTELYYTFNEMLKMRGKNNVELRIAPHCRNSELVVLTDPTRLKQIFSNLINNAIKFTDEGFIEIGFTHEFPDKIQFYVQDTGIGIPYDKQRIIFQRFRQVEETYTRNYEGTGLGLSISKKLTNLLGGDMWVESEPGQGSTFFFTLPFELAGPAKKQPAAPARINNFDDFTLSGKKILVVEDEPTNFRLIEGILAPLKAELIHANNGFDAVDTAESLKNELDLILMDIKIPGINGYEATRKIRNMKVTVPIIAQTACAMSSERQKCLEAGCDDYISKPFGKDDLLRVISRNLKKEPNPKT
ncbi:MAG: hybrid sensor histidine kinase/response regulator transcription factor [Bacteroidales bacterium]